MIVSWLPGPVSGGSGIIYPTLKYMPTLHLWHLHPARVGPGSDIVDVVSSFEMIIPRGFFSFFVCSICTLKKFGRKLKPKIQVQKNLASSKYTVLSIITILNTKTIHTAFLYRMKHSFKKTKYYYYNTSRLSYSEFYEIMETQQVICKKYQNEQSNKKQSKIRHYYTSKLPPPFSTISYSMHMVS